MAVEGEGTATAAPSLVWLRRAEPAVARLQLQSSIARPVRKSACSARYSLAAERRKKRCATSVSDTCADR
jgi:hypothetical protein